MYFARFQVAVASLACLLLISSLQASTADATPRMSATSGAPCSTCHYDSGGGGLRTSIGFGNQMDLGAFSYEDIGLGFMEKADTNKAHDWLALGGDVRIQVTRLGQPTLGEDDEGNLEAVAPRRHVLPMQIEPNVAITPTHWLSFLGSYALGPGITDGDFCSTVYAGQSCFSAQAQFRPPPKWPTVRAGYFRPNIGIHHDDHTMLTTADATRARPSIVPPNYAEAGVEASYQPRRWVRFDAGGFRAANLAESINDPDIVSASNPAYLGRVNFTPHFELAGLDLYGWAGGSVYGAGSFRNDQAFLGLGWIDEGSLMFELSHLDFGSEVDKRGLNASTLLSVELKKWLVAQGRLEQATTFVEDDTRIRRSAVAGLQIYPVPFIKLQPEYRYTRTDVWSMGQYTVQLHLFY